MNKQKYLILAILVVGGVGISAGLSYVLSESGYEPEINHAIDTPKILDADKVDKSRVMDNVSVANVAVDNEPTEYFYVQTSEAGSLNPLQKSKNTWHLTLIEPNPQVNWFTDRPVREAGYMDFKELESQLFSSGQSPPNADLTFTDESGNQHSFQVELLNTLSQNGNVSYTITFLIPTDNTPKTLNDVSLFIDTKIWNYHCQVNVNTPTDLTLVKELTHPHPYSNHWDPLQSSINKSNDKFTKFGSDQSEGGGDGSSFDMYYDFKDYDVRSHFHTHCAWTAHDAADFQVHKVTAELKGRQNMLFEVNANKNEICGKCDAEDNNNQGHFNVNKLHDTGIWFELTLPDSDYAYEADSYQVILREGDDYVLQSPNHLTGYTDVKTGPREIQVCLSNGDDCATSNITLKTSDVPVVSCEYSNNAHSDDLPSLACTSSLEFDDGGFEDKNSTKYDPSAHTGKKDKQDKDQPDTDK